MQYMAWYQLLFLKEKTCFRPLGFLLSNIYPTPGGGERGPYLHTLYKYVHVHTVFDTSAQS